MDPVVPFFCSLDHSFPFLMVKAHLQSPSDRTDGQPELTQAWCSFSWAGPRVLGHAKKGDFWAVMPSCAQTGICLCSGWWGSWHEESLSTFLLICDLLTSLCVRHAWDTCQADCWPPDILPSGDTSVNLYLKCPLQVGAYLLK